MRGRRIGLLSGCGALAVLVGMVGAVLANGQTMRRPALGSGSASVALIARVESLSLVANAETVVGPMVAGEAGAAPAVSITTRWAVPANFTTFRVTRYFGGPESFAEDGVGSLVVESGRQTRREREPTCWVGLAAAGRNRLKEGC